MSEDKKPAELDNERNIIMMTNDRAEVQPLIIMFPQWSKFAINLMPKLRQEQIYSDFAHEVGEAWETLLREKI